NPDSDPVGRPERHGDADGGGRVRRTGHDRLEALCRDAVGDHRRRREPDQRVQRRPDPPRSGQHPGAEGERHPMSLYVYLEPDRDRLAEVGPQFQSIGTSIVNSMADLEAHLPRYPETLLVVIGASVPLDEVLMFTAYQRLQRPLIGVVLVRHELLPDDV